MKALVLSDIHGVGFKLDKLVAQTNPQVVIIPGDLPSSIDLPVLIFSYLKGKSRREYVKQIYERFTQRISYRQIRTAKRILLKLSKLSIPVILIHGNTETKITNNWMELYCHRFPNLHWISDKPVEIKGIVFVGHGFVGVPSDSKRAKTPGEIDEESDYLQLRYALNRAKIEFPEKELVLVSHAPPHNTTIDFLKHKNYHAGSKGVRKVLEEGLVKKVISGHLHESFGVYHESNWWALNAGAVVDDIACTVNIDNGAVYWYKSLIHRPSLNNLIYGSRNRMKYDTKG